MDFYIKNMGYNQPPRQFLLYVILSLTLFAVPVFAATNQTNIPIQDNNGLFNADNSEEGVKNNRPVNLSIDQDSLLGVVGDLKTLLDFNAEHAGAVELAAGPKVLRGNATYAFALDDKNRIKFTGEYLDENLDFDFYTGDTRQWVNQAAVGTAYQYWLDGNTFKDFQMGAYYSHAGNKNLSDKIIDLGNGTTLVDQRRIAGGTDWNGTLETGLRLWPHSFVTTGADYDRVRYDTHYDIHHDGGDAQGFGGHANLQQLLTSSTQLELQSTVTQLANVFGSGLDWIWTTRNTTAWKMGLNSSYTTDHTTERNFWINSINLNIVWDEPHPQGSVAGYSDPNVSAENLLTWAATPAVRMPDVLAISDERIRTTGSNYHFEPITATCPAVTDIKYDSSNSTYSAPGGWGQIYPYPSNLSDGSTNDLAFSSAGIMTGNIGPVQCQYNLKVKEKFILANSTYNKVQPMGSYWTPGSPGAWPSGSSQQPAVGCIGLPDTCPFETVDPNTVISNQNEANQEKS